MNNVALRWIAAVLSALAIAITFATILLQLGGSGETAGADLGAKIGNVLAGSQPLVVSIVGTIIILRQPRNPVGWTLVLGAIGHASQTFAAAYVTLATMHQLPGAAIAAWAADWLDAATWPTLFLGTLLFPNGRLLSPRWRAVASTAIVVPLLIAFLRAVTPGPVFPFDSVENPFGLPGGAGDLLRTVDLREYGNLLGLLFFPTVLSVVLRFRRATGEERQQLKWFAYAVGLTAGVMILAVSGVLGPAADIVSTISITGIPIAVGIAILRYRLYDIDLIINRTLVYAALTASLAMVYLAGVVVLQQAFRAFTGQESSLAVVASTLAIAVLFQPLRHRIQTFIDRRFYRRKYDATRVLEAFGTATRDEVELSRLSEQLLGVVGDAMQPTNSSLWLRDPDRRPTARKA